MEVLNPDYPSGFFPLKQIGKELSYEVSRLKSICKSLSIDIVSIGSVSYISNEAKPILEKAVLAKKGGDKSDFTSFTTTKVISPKKVKTGAPEASGTSGLVVREAVGGSTTPEQFFQMLVEVMKQQQPPQASISPIQQHRELKDAADNGFLLTAEQLSNIFGLKKSSISSWKSGHRRFGFQFTRIKENNISLWKVEQY